MELLMVNSPRETHLDLEAYPDAHVSIWPVVNNRCWGRPNTSSVGSIGEYDLGEDRPLDDPVGCRVVMEVSACSRGPNDAHGAEL